MQNNVSIPREKDGQLLLVFEKEKQLVFTFKQQEKSR